MAYVTSDGICMKKLYPEQAIQPRFRTAGSGWVYLYCNKHGLFRQRTPRRRPLTFAPEEPNAESMEAIREGDAFLASGKKGRFADGADLIAAAMA